MIWGYFKKSNLEVFNSKDHKKAFSSVWSPIWLYDNVKKKPSLKLIKEGFGEGFLCRQVLSR